MKASKRIFALMVFCLMIFNTVSAFAADRDVWEKATETKFATRMEMRTDKAKILKVRQKPNDYYFEANGHLFDMKTMYEEFAKDKLNFVAQLVPAKAVKPVEEGLKVASVSAITKFSVDVTFAKPLEEAVKDATLNVKDNKGAVVEVVKKDLSKGATVASFDFKKALAEDPEGKWTVNGIEKDLDLEKYIADFVNAADQVKLNKALNDLKIANVKAENVGAYLAAKADFLTENPNPTVEAIQKFVDEVNANEVTADDVKAIIEAAQANKDVLLVNLLKAGGFERVNEDWIVANYKAQIATLVPGTGTKKDIQEKIDAANDAAAVAAEGALTTVASDKLEDALKAKSAIVNYHSEDVAPVTTKADLIKKINFKIAILKLKHAKTEAAAYSALEDLKQDLTLKPFYPGLKKYYQASANAVAAYTIASVNTTVIDAAETAFTGEVQVAADADALLKLLKKYPAENVLDANKALYKAENHAAANTLAKVKAIVVDANKKAMKPDAANSGEDLQIAKSEYMVGEDFTITFTLRDSNKKVLAEINGNTDATVKANADVVSLAKAEIVNGKVTITGKFGAAGALADLKVDLVDPAVTGVARAGVQIVVKEADKPVHFKVEKGGTNGVKFTALDVNYKKMTDFDGTVRMENVSLKLKDGAEEYTQVVALDGLTLGSADVTFTNSEVDNQLNTTALTDGDYQLTFTVEGVTHTLTFKKS